LRILSTAKFRNYNEYLYTNIQCIPLLDYAKIKHNLTKKKCIFNLTFLKKIQLKIFRKRKIIGRNKHGRYTSKIVVKGEYIPSILQVKLLK